MSFSLAKICDVSGQGPAVRITGDNAVGAGVLPQKAFQSILRVVFVSVKCSASKYRFIFQIGDGIG
jgi:hypothetical protein